MASKSFLSFCRPETGAEMHRASAAQPIGGDKFSLRLSKPARPFCPVKGEERERRTRSPTTRTHLAGRDPSLAFPALAPFVVPEHHLPRPGQMHPPHCAKPYAHFLPEAPLLFRLRPRSPGISLHHFLLPRRWGQRRGILDATSGFRGLVLRFRPPGKGIGRGRGGSGSLVGLPRGGRTSTLAARC